MTQADRKTGGYALWELDRPLSDFPNRKPWGDLPLSVRLGYENRAQGILDLAAKLQTTVKLPPLLAASGLPWRPISELTPTLGGPNALVCSGEDVVWASWRYAVDLTDQLDPNLPCWADGSHALNPQPEFYLPLSLPDGRAWPFPEPAA